jgi:hypothetical protein
VVHGNPSRAAMAGVSCLEMHNKKGAAQRGRLLLAMRGL